MDLYLRPDLKRGCFSQQEEDHHHPDLVPDILPAPHSPASLSSPTASSTPARSSKVSYRPDPYPLPSSHPISI